MKYEKIVCDNCKWSVIVKTTDECYIECANENTYSSFPDERNCKYFEKKEKKQ